VDKPTDIGVEFGAPVTADHDAVAASTIDNLDG
jgi:hypothetical protein